MSKRARDPKSAVSEQKKPCKVQTTLFKYCRQNPTSTSSKAAFDFSPQQYGIHIYSEDEIKKAVGLKQDFRKFWNEKAVEICKDKNSRDKLHNKNAIEGAIYASWRLQCSHLLQLQAEEVIEDAKACITDSVSRALFLSSIQKNLERMQEAQASTHQHVFEATSIDDPSEKQLFESELHQKMSHLKSAQNALKKAIIDKRWQLNTETGVAKQEAEILIADTPTELSGDEMEMLIHTFNNETYEDTESDD